MKMFIFLIAIVIFGICQIENLSNVAGAYVRTIDRATELGNR